MSNNATKEELAQKASTRSGVSIFETRKVLDATFHTIVDILKDKRDIQLKGFGTFKVVRRAEKIARNPATGEPIVIPERDVPVLKFAKNVKELVE